LIVYPIAKRRQFQAIRAIALNAAEESRSSKLSAETAALRALPHPGRELPPEQTPWPTLLKMVAATVAALS
jgi:hypothetical protein